MLLAKTKLDTIKVLISKSLINSFISHDEFVSVNNVLREYNKIIEEIKILNLLWNTLYKYDWQKQKTYERNSVKTMVDNDEILWLNKKHIEEGLDHINLWKVTIKCHLDHKKNRFELVDEPKKQSNRIFIDGKLTITVIMECRKTSAYKFRTKLGFKQ